jgi:hypothetical protein
MRKHIVIIILISLFSCKVTQEITSIKPYTKFKIINTLIKVKNDTLTINELRFYKIQSAMDGMKLMYRSYGKWNQKIVGKHQKNINRIIWQNIKLFDEDDNTFTVIADGAETTSDYFACLMVYDSDEKDCFKAGHPYKDKLTELFIDKMNIIDKNSKVYRLFK